MMEMQVLIASKDQSLLDACRRAAKRMKCEVRSAATVSAAIELISGGGVDIVLADVQLPGLRMPELIEAARRCSPESHTIALAEAESAALAQQAVRQGARACLVGPFETGGLERLLERPTHERRMSRENGTLREQLEAGQGMGTLIGASAKMQRIYEIILKVANKRHPVLVLGESGTGKELVARAIHSYGPWRDLPFVPVDCGALSPTLIESELFGHVRGAFRKDLFFRLNVLSIKLPPLRERKNDIPLLVHHFINRYSGIGGIKHISEEAMSRLMNYDWPGNVRELENCIQRSLALGSPPEIQVKDLPSSVLYSMQNGSGRQRFSTLRERERDAIRQALEMTGGDRLQAAKLLGIGKTTVYRKIKEYELDHIGNPMPT